MASEFKERQSTLQRIFSYAVFAPIILAALFYVLELTPVAQQLENITLDQRTVFRSTSQAAPDSRLFFVAIDDTTVQKVGQWPIDRANYGDFLKVMSLAKPKTMCFDIIFDQPSTDPASDEAFLAGLKATTDASISVYTGTASSAISDEFRLPKDYKTNWPAGPDALKADKISTDYLLIPNQALRQAAGQALVDVPKDNQGIGRKIKMYVVANGYIVPTISLSLLMDYWNVKPEQVTFKPGDAIYIKSDLVSKRIPIDRSGYYTVNYRYDIVTNKESKFYDMPTFSNASFYALFTNYYLKFTENAQNPNLPVVKDKIILVGLTSTASTELGPSPFQAESPRPLIHINAMDNILKDDYLKTFSPIVTWISFLLIGYLSLWGLSKASFWLSSTIPLFVIVIFIGIAFFAFKSNSLALPLVGPCTAFFLLHVGSVSAQVLKERAARDHLRRTFSTYVSSGILDAIYKNPDALQLGGGYKDVTILFSDIRSFTTMTESMDSVALVQQLNEYFTEMVGCINKYNGTLHKFIGDAIMAVWGDVAYAGSTIDAGQALRAAIDMREALKVLNARWVSEGRPEFHMGVGINHGKVVVGNIGAPQRMEFTVIGDSVNLASRLEGLTKKFGTEIMVGESVYDLTHERFAFRSLAKVQVVGKTQPTKIFEPLYEIGQEGISPYSPEWVRLFEEAYARFTERRYDVAIRLFEACLNEHPDNTTTLMLLDMSRNFSQQPPPEDWNGAFEFTSK